MLFGLDSLLFQGKHYSVLPIMDFDMMHTSSAPKKMMKKESNLLRRYPRTGVLFLSAA